MKLFLASLAIADSQSSAFLELVGKQDPAEVRIALIENAADGEVGEKPWVAENRKAIQAHGYDVEIVDLNDYKRDDNRNRFRAKLKNKDVVWLGGGNDKYGHIMHSIKDKFEASGYKTCRLTDGQALIVDGDKQVVIG